MVATGLLALFAGLALVRGGLLLWGRPLPVGVVAPPVLLPGWAIGADTDIGAVVAGAGLFVAAGLFVLNMAALAPWAGAHWPVLPVLPRIAGSWFFALSLMVLALRFGTGGGLAAGLP